MFVLHTQKCIINILYTFDWNPKNQESHEISYPESGNPMFGAVQKWRHRGEEDRLVTNGDKGGREGAGTGKWWRHHKKNYLNI